MQDEQISGSESMLIIQNMINKAKNQFSENGFMYLLWGWAVLLCGLAQFVLLHFFQSPNHYFVWFFTWVVLIFQIFYLRKERRTRRVHTYTEDIIKYVWICFVVVIFLAAFLLGRIIGPEYYRHMNPMLLIVYGIPTFLSGIILRFRPLVFGGISCWLLSIAAAFIPYDYQILLLCAGVLFAWIIPGFLLRARYKKENS